jgi:ubiquitin-protein ligase
MRAKATENIPIFIPHNSTLSHTRQNHTHHHQSMSSNKISTTRLLREYRKIKKDPPDYITARPLENNVLQWHYVIEGPPKTPYASGIYHGVLTFPPGTSCLYFVFQCFFFLPHSVTNNNNKTEYPWKPPSIKMCTPSGRFEINRRLCLSMSGMFYDLLFFFFFSLLLYNPHKNPPPDFHPESWNVRLSLSLFRSLDHTHTHARAHSLHGP